MASEPRMPPSVMAEPQPCCGPSMIDQVSRVMPATDSSAPSGSNRPASWSRDSGSSRRPAMTATTRTGTDTWNTEDQSKCRSSAPPDSGPTATARPETADQTPIAMARSLDTVNTLFKIANVAG